jgi:non-heme chloroperoxidase
MLSAKLVKGATLKVYPGLSHGLFATHHAMVNADMLKFFQEH